MIHPKLFATPARFIFASIWFLLLLAPGHGTSKHTPWSPAYIQRGDRVQQHYETYLKRLTAYYEGLAIALRKVAPDLLTLLEAPRPTSHGYQVLPAIVSDLTPQESVRSWSMGYSWPWTDRLIDQESVEITRAAADLERAKQANPGQGRAMLEKLARDYRRRRIAQDNIDAHIQYNRFWQATVAADRASYDRETLLHNEVVERLKIVNGLKVLDRVTVGSQAGENASFELAQIAGNLRKREALLAGRISDAINQVRIPRFVITERLADEWIFRVPVYTDIEDRDFVEAVKRSIESIWRLRAGQDSFRVDLNIVYVSSEELYPEGRPANGTPISILRHVARFPASGAILTTGAQTTHVQNNAIVLGPHSVTPRLLAHEFGHILGFRDGYVRGYRNLRGDGFQIMEVISDPADIMAAPLSGMVLRSHFEALLRHAAGLPRSPSEPRLSKNTHRSLNA